MKTFTLNGNSVVAREIDFNLLAELDDYGISIEDAGTKPLAFMRAYVACCKGSTLAEAGNEMNAHFINGGDFEDIMDVMNASLEDSDFFRALQNKQTEIQETPTTGKAKKEK
jgi:hypothetical protein